jgi:hypothetical protein
MFLALSRSPASIGSASPSPSRFGPMRFSTAAAASPFSILRIIASRGVSFTPDVLHRYLPAPTWLQSRHRRPRGHRLREPAEKSSPRTGDMGFDVANRYSAGRHGSRHCGGSIRSSPIFKRNGRSWPQPSTGCRRRRCCPGSPRSSSTAGQTSPSKRPDGRSFEGGELMMAPAARAMWMAEWLNAEYAASGVRRKIRTTLRENNWNDLRPPLRNWVYQLHPEF